MVKMAADAASNAIPSFFRVLLQDFSQKLWLPRAFLDRVTNEQSCGKATLVNPNGGSYRVDVCRDACRGMHFGGDGWVEFLRQHKLELGHFLVFRYRGGMVFDLRAYDLSTCEIAYPDPAAAPETGKPAQAQEERADQTRNREADRRTRRPLGRPRRKPGSAQAREERDGQGTTGRAVETRDRQADRRMRTPVGRPWKQQGFHDSASPKGRAFKGRCFEATMTTSKVSRPFMNIPVAVMTAHTELRQQREVMLKDPDGRSWVVRLYHSKAHPHHTHLSTGWDQFARGNKLKLGDRCVFELVNRGKGKGKVMNVQIIRRRGGRGRPSSPF